MAAHKKLTFLFPGQGAQYPGMGKDFADRYPSARYLIEEADDILHRKLSSIIFQGSGHELTETRNSQTAIYVISLAILQVINELFPKLIPQVCSGLSLGEYTALTAAKYLSFQECLPLVQMRGELMNEACLATKGAMAVVMGLESKVVEAMVKEVNMPNDLWAANFNCPGQVVISGTIKGIEAGTVAAKARGAKRVVELPVHGAFHSGLMQQAEDRLAPFIQQVQLNKGQSEIVMNVPGDFVKEEDRIRNNLIKQVTSPVRWEQGVYAMDRHGCDFYIEIGPGKTLSGMNKRIGITWPTISIEKIEDLDLLSKILN